MIGLDTNVLVRYLAQDDERQSPVATRFVEKTLTADDRGFISLIVLAEVVWVLVSLYSLDRTGVCKVITTLLTTEQLHVESAELVWRAKRQYEESKADLSDALVAECSAQAGCEHSVTFDRAAAGLTGFELLK